MLSLAQPPDQHVWFMASHTCQERSTFTLLFKKVALDDLIHGLHFLLLEFDWRNACVELIEELAAGRKSRILQSLSCHLETETAQLSIPLDPPIPGRA